jgi:ABC-type Co2+ transport system permease subunit
LTLHCIRDIFAVFSPNHIELRLISMHIEPGVVDGAKIILSVATSAIACGLTIKACLETRKSSGTAVLVQRSVIATFLVFCFFEVLWHHPVGISEVHLIMGSSLFLLFGAGPTAIGLTLGLLIQGLLFAPTDLPQFGMNLTSLLLPLFALNYVARRVISPRTAYVDLSSQGFSVPTITSILSFGGAYIGVIALESCLDLCLLAGAKRVHQLRGFSFFDSRLLSTGQRLG